MICSNCQFYTRLIEDDDDWCGTPWCLLADDALPDDIFRPFDCICPDLKERKERVEGIEADPCPVFNSVKFPSLLWAVIMWFRLRRAGCRHVRLSRYRGRSREELIKEAQKI